VELADRRCELVISRRSAHWTEDALPDSDPDIVCDSSTLDALLVGEESWQTARDAGRLRCMSPPAEPLLSALFPERLWHFTLLDWL
jgi:hypothetical protein